MVNVCYFLFIFNDYLSIRRIAVSGVNVSTRKQTKLCVCVCVIVIYNF